MALDIVRGQGRNLQEAERLASHLSGIVHDGTLYLAYPVLATADDRIDVDALLVSDLGVVAFLFAGTTDPNQLIGEQDRLYGVLESHLGRNQSLRRGRKLAITPATATILPTDLAELEPEEPAVSFFGTLDGLDNWLETVPRIDPDLERSLHAALQRVSTIKPAKRREKVAGETTRGATLKTIERHIANLDRWQQAAAIESPQGPQRIRGLAGSGKTVVLSLKAAYWHTQNPSWLIALTFHTRALHQQLTDLVERFTFEHSNDRPDPLHLQIMHSWGSRSEPGIYSTVAAALNEPIRDFAYASGTFGRENAFQGACAELLAVAAKERPEPIFDAVLIDEAQDLPPEFFRLVHLFTREPKRVVWGYDEMQRLSEAAMPDTEELFGTDSTGGPIVNLSNRPNSPRRDIVLPVCYRNTPWALATAHALGLGIYRQEGGLLQHPDDPSLWSDIGYEVESGRLRLGSQVRLRRSAESTPPYFEQLVKPKDAIVSRVFSNEDEQDSWIAKEIRRNLDEDELDEDDILIVLPDVYRAKSRAPRLMRELTRQKIVSHLAGVNTSRDSVFRTGSVALAHIFRAKGNEAPMVYAVDSQYAGQTFNPVTRRNGLFTAITRSRAWLRITGWGTEMKLIESEIKAVVQNSYTLDFKVPTNKQLERMRHVYRERTRGEEEMLKKTTANLNEFFEAIEKGELNIIDLPPDVRTRLIAMLASQDDDFADDDA